MLFKRLKTLHTHFPSCSYTFLLLYSRSSISSCRLWRDRLFHQERILTRVWPVLHVNLVQLLDKSYLVKDAPTKNTVSLLGHHYYEHQSEESNQDRYTRPNGKSLSKMSNTSCIRMDERSRGGVDTFWWQDIIQTYVIESIQRLDIWSKSNLSNLIGVYGRGNIDGILAGSQCRLIVSMILP
jgi:hypothetical protein